MNTFSESCKICHRPAEPRMPAAMYIPCTDEEPDARLISMLIAAVFGARWANEQSRQLGPRPTDDDEQDNWDEALGFLDACGPVSRGHIARTVSAEHGLGASLRSHGSGLSGGWLEESQREVGNPVEPSSQRFGSMPLAR